MTAAVKVELAVRRDLKAFPAKARTSSLALSALALARRIDRGDVTPPELAALSRELRACMADLAEATPPARESDGIDEIAAARAKRRSDAAAKAGTPDA